MNAFELGPLVLSGERLSIIIGIFVFVIGSGFLASRVSIRFNAWSTVIVFGGVLVARLAYVVANWQHFQADPLRAVAVWQGGFAWLWVIPVVALATAALLKTAKERAWALAPVAVSALAWIAAHQLASATEPLPPAEITLAQLDGAPFDLATPSDRPTVINVWASWCPPCRREMPALAAAQKANPDVRFLFVNQGEGEATVRTYLAREGLTLEHVLLDPHMDLPRHYGTVGLPITFFLGSDGRLAKAHLGEIGPERIAAEIARLD